MAAIEFQNARFSYDGVRNAIDGVTLRIEQGSFVCILGGNGSGKSTLAKHVNALLAPDDGKVIVLGLDTSDSQNVFPIRSNAGMVFQNPDDQIVASVIENDVAFGPENLGVPTDELRTRVTAALAQVGLQGFEKKQTEALSGGQKQRVAVAGVLATEPQIIVFDEASAMLDPRGRAGLMRVCRELNESGLTIVLITHFMEEAALADRVVVLDHGTVALDGAPGDVLLQAERLAALALEVPFATRMSMALRKRGVPVGMHADEPGLERELVSLLSEAGAQGVLAGAVSGAHRDTDAQGVTTNVDALAQDGAIRIAAADSASAASTAPSVEDALRTDSKEPTPAAQQDGRDATPAIEFRGVSFTYQPVSQTRHRKSSVGRGGKRADWGRAPDEYWALKDVSFAIREGEFFGIAGHTGSGKSTLIQLSNGLLKPNEGTVLVRGQALEGRKSATFARADVGVVFQYPEHQLFAATVFDDVAFGPRNLGYSSAEVEERVRAAMNMVHLDLDELRDRNPFELSGGQQRRVAFAGVLAMDPHTLVLDEPVAGLDPRAKRRFLDLLAEMHREQGLTIVVVSHNMDDLAELCDRVLVLNEGALFALDEPSRVFADEQALKSVGLGVPHAAHLANGLLAAGINLPVGTVPTVDELAGAIGSRLHGQQEGR